MHKRLRSFTILCSAALTLLLAPLAARAQKTAMPAPGTSWPKLIQALQDEGVAQVGALDLTDFSRQAQKIQWVENAKDAPDVIAGARTSAFYIHDSAQQIQNVYISQTIPADALAAMPDLETHEGLGALGIEDQQYEKTTALRLLLEIKNPTDRARLLESYGHGLFNQNNLHIQMQGGSSVGGGGDIRTILIKNQVLSEILQGPHKINLNFLQSYPRINFEPVYADNDDYVSLHYEYRNDKSIANMGRLPRVPYVNGHQELISIYIPMHVWEQGTAARKKIVQEIKAKVMDFFPAYADDRATIVVPICQGKQKAVIPYTDDGDVAYIQIVRQGLLRGCDQGQDLASSASAPKLPEGVEIHQPGMMYFKCVFSQGEKKNIQYFQTAFGAKQMRLMQVEIAENTNLWAIPTLNEYGQFTRLIMRGSVGGKDTDLLDRSMQPASNVSNQVQFKGAKYGFTCTRQ